MQKIESQSFVKNSSFLSRDIEAQKGATLKRVKSNSPPKNEVVTSPPVSSFKTSRTNSKEESSPKERAKALVKQESVIKEPKENKVEATARELQSKLEKLEIKVSEKIEAVEKTESKVELSIEAKNNEESNGVGDKIKKFEKAAEDASSKKLSRPGSVRRRAERSGSEGSDLPPPPAVPCRDTETMLTTQQPNQKAPAKWQKSRPEYDPDKIRKPEPQRIIKPEFKPAQSPVEVTIRSPSLGTKISDSFPSQGTAFRNVAPVAPVAPIAHVAPVVAREHNDVNTQNNVKTCKVRKEKYSISKGSSYFTRGSEEIWLVKKKDIEEIEERVLDSFRRAGGGNVCMRSEPVRPASDSGQNASMSHTMGRTKRQMYARSESLDPQHASQRAQTLKRQTSVACTCGHDKNKGRSKSSCDSSRPRSRSHGDDNQAHVLDKYETLV